MIFVQRGFDEEPSTQNCRGLLPQRPFLSFTPAQLGCRRRSDCCPEFRR